MNARVRTSKAIGREPVLVDDHHDGGVAKGIARPEAI
jgi:hypothetical protein